MCGRKQGQLASTSCRSDLEFDAKSFESTSFASVLGEVDEATFGELCGAIGLGGSVMS